MTDLCRGWTERDVVAAVRASNDTQGAMLRHMADHPGCTIFAIADELGLTYPQARAQLAAFTRTVTRPMGVLDPATGRDSWPFVIEAPKSGRGASTYHMPNSVAAIVRRET
jgi:hypothetical protein